jgi:membrane-bound metal-dependent hydrolase YbcI (DUF457 family)
MLANLPDFDFPISLGLLGNASLHHEFTHSLAAAILVALAVRCVWRIAPVFWRSAMIYFAAYGSHLLIDLCTGRTLGCTNTGAGKRFCNHCGPRAVISFKGANSPALVVAQKISTRPWYWFPVRHQTLRAISISTMLRRVSMNY